MERGDKEAGKGLALATAVYLAWGVLPAYWKLLSREGPAAIIAHRALWAFASVAIALALVYRPKRIFEPLSDRKTLALCVLASLSLVLQWAVYLLAVVNDRLVDLSLGYFIYPIAFSIAGSVFLKERMSLPRKIALGLACAGVLAKLVQFGTVPILALGLAASFAAYSVIKRKIGLSPVSSIFFEFLFMLPFAIAFFVYCEATGRGSFLPSDPRTSLLLVGGGVLTSATLFLFAAAARRIPAFTLGFLQYISPTIVLLLGVFAYGEPFGADQWLVFGLIWLALIVSFAPDARIAARARKP